MNASFGLRMVFLRTPGSTDYSLLDQFTTKWYLLYLRKVTLTLCMIMNFPTWFDKIIIEGSLYISRGHMVELPN